MKRVMIIGGAGSGKSTLAREIGDRTGLPVIHIDPMYWSPGWVQRPAAETMVLSLEAAARPEWVFEGNHTPSMTARIERADTFIFLDVPTPLRLWRVVVRTIKHYGRSRPDMPPGCSERFDWEFLKFVANYGKNGRLRALDLMPSLPPHLLVFHLKRRGDVAAFLQSLSKSNASTQKVEAA